MPAFLAWPVIKAFFGNALSSVWAGIKGFFGSLNSQGWVGLIAFAVMAFLWVQQWGETRHWHKQSDRFEKLYNADEASMKHVAEQAIALKQKLDGLARNISTTLKEQHDAQSTRISADAHAVLVRGPGKAACPSHSGLSAEPSGHEQTPAAPAAAGPQVPSGDWAAVPWNWLVQVIEEHDQLLNDDKTYRENDAKQRALRLTTPAPEVGHSKPNG